MVEIRQGDKIIGRLLDQAFHNMNVTIVDELGEENKVALRWILSAMFDKEFLDLQLSNNDETRGLEIIQIVRERNF